jgi:branched-chain amino acid transport system substrate-binding protein
MGVRIILVAAALACGLTVAHAADREINVILPLTGGGAFLGKAEQQALMQFEKAANADGGIHGQPLKFVFHDD